VHANVSFIVRWQALVAGVASKLVCQCSTYNAHRSAQIPLQAKVKSPKHAITHLKSTQIWKLSGTG